MPVSEVAQQIAGGRYRVYKKTKDHYRVEQRQPNGWVELETDKQIGQLLLQNCRFVVHENGRVDTVGKRFAASVDVPVHAWIECGSYSFAGTPFAPQGILYYNPFTVRYFMDRASYEAGAPRVLSGAGAVRIDGNFLEYSGGRFMSMEPQQALVQESTEAYDLALIYSPLDRDAGSIVESTQDALIYSPLPADYVPRVSRQVRKIMGQPEEEEEREDEESHIR